MTAAVWSWADVPGLDAPPPSTRPARRPRARRRLVWPMVWLMVDEHASAPAGATLAQAKSAVNQLARIRGLRFVIHVTGPGDTGLFIRRVAPGRAGPGYETVRGPVPASSRLVSPEAAS